MSRVVPSDVSRRFMLRGAIAGAGIMLAQPLGSLVTSQAAAAEPTAASSAASETADATQKAAAWLEGAVLPPGAVRTTASPTPALALQETAWRYTPMVVATGYWTIAGATVAETANWLSANPTADLIVPVPLALPDEVEFDLASVGNVPHADALEGIAYTIAKTSEGVAVRADIGVAPEGAIRPIAEPGISWGAPGQG